MVTPWRNVFQTESFAYMHGLQRYARLHLSFYAFIRSYEADCMQRIASLRRKVLHVSRHTYRAKYTHFF